jgi:signal transduction histidine kinase
VTIRARLVAATFLLQVLSMAGLGWGVLLIQHQLHERDVENSARVIESTITRAAQEALLQKDDLQLISYINFAKSQYPAVAYARLDWRSGDRVRTTTLGAPPSLPGAVRETRLHVENPADRTRDVGIVLGVDRDVLERPLVDSRRRLGKAILAAWAATALLGLIVSVGLASSFTRPLDALGRVAEQVGEGKLGAKLEWESDDELGRLVRVFNMMSARLEELDAAKRNFVSSVTHELRSPLGAIESFLQLIREKVGAGPEGFRQSEQYLGRIEVNVRRLSGFINDLLDVAKIEKGRMECVLRSMELGPMASDVCQFFEAKAAQQSVSVSSKMDGIPDVLGDSDRLRQVLVNLVSNGLKFTGPGGRIVIGAEQVREGGQRWVEVSVSDTGRGMDAADRQRLFQPFTQGRNIAEGVAGHKGTGLGLYIVKSIIDQHGGRIDVQSVPGRGTTVRFSLRAV